jgi:putative membrane protein
VQNYNKIALMLSATICFAVSGIAFGQAGSASPGGAPGQSSTSGQSGAAGRAGTTPQTGAGSQPSAPSGSSSGHSMSASADQKFAEAAAAGNAAEIQMGKLATEKAANEKVKQFGERMVTDHTKASAELKAIAAKKGMTLPDSPKPKDQATIEKLSKLSGPAFDKAYMRDMVKDHQKDVAEFQKEATNGSDPDLKAWAGTTLPILQEHLKLARETLSALNEGATSASTGSAQSTGK